jgi:hypothetical protein
MASLLSLDEPLLSLVVAAVAGDDFASLARLSCVCRRLRAHAQAAHASLRTLDVSPLGRRAAGALRLAGARCGALESLACCDAGGVGDADIAAAVCRSAATLRVLTLRGLRHVTDGLGAALCSPAAPLRRLEALDLRGCRGVGDAFLAALLLRPDGVPTAQAGGAVLSWLDVADTSVSDAGVGLLHRLPALRHVDLGFTPVVDGVRFLGAGSASPSSASARGVTHAGLARWFAGAPRADGEQGLPLRALCLAHRKEAGHEALELLGSACPFLEVLDLSHARVAGPFALAACAQRAFAPRLRVLRLAAPTESAADDDVASLVRACSALEELDLSLHGRLTDVALAALAALPRLRALTLVRNAHVTPDGLRALLDAPAAPLRRLRVVRCMRCGAGAMRQLAAQHAACSIEWE